jgi:hypothetical protein
MRRRAGGALQPARALGELVLSGRPLMCAPTTAIGRAAARIAGSHPAAAAARVLPSGSGPARCQRAPNSQQRGRALVRDKRDAERQAVAAEACGQASAPEPKKFTKLV